MKYWSFPVTATVLDLLSRVVNAPIEGPELTSVVCTIPSQIEVLPICVLPLKVCSSNFIVNDFTEAIVASKVDLCADVRLIVLDAVPFAQPEMPEMVRCVVPP